MLTRKGKVSDRWWWHNGLLLFLFSVTLLLSVSMSPSTGQLSLGGWVIPELCMYKRMFHFECPGCGLTRSFVFMGHGDWAAAWGMNKIGPLLFVITATQVPYRMYLIARDYIRLRRAPTPPV